MRRALLVLLVLGCGFVVLAGDKCVNYHTVTCVDDEPRWFTAGFRDEDGTLIRLANGRFMYAWPSDRSCPLPLDDGGTRPPCAAKVYYKISDDGRHWEGERLAESDGGPMGFEDTAATILSQDADGTLRLSGDKPGIGTWIRRGSGLWQRDGNIMAGLPMEDLDSATHFVDQDDRRWVAYTKRETFDGGTQNEMMVAVKGPSAYDAQGTPQYDPPDAGWSITQLTNSHDNDVLGYMRVVRARDGAPLPIVLWVSHAPLDEGGYFGGSSTIRVATKNDVDGGWVSWRVTPDDGETDSLPYPLIDGAEEPFLSWIHYPDRHEDGGVVMVPNDDGDPIPTGAQLLVPLWDFLDGGTLDGPERVGDLSTIYKSPYRGFSIRSYPLGDGTALVTWVKEAKLGAGTSGLTQRKDNECLVVDSLRFGESG